MSVNVSWATVGAGLILLCSVAVIAVAWYFVDQQRTTAEERRQLRALEREIAGVQLPPWDGADYDWPPNLEDYLNDPYAYNEPTPTKPFPAVPSSTISGPLPKADDTEAFIAAMRAQTDAWIAAFAEPEPVA